MKKRLRSAAIAGVLITGLVIAFTLISSLLISPAPAVLADSYVSSPLPADLSVPEVLSETPVPVQAQNTVSQTAAATAQSEASQIPPASSPKPSSLSFSLSIPSIGLQAPIIKVGINKKGEMDVPDGKTNNVGWYKDGTKPGQLGSAVLDAHVYAAFKKLKNVRAGDAVYVKNENGENLKFIVEKTEVTPLEEVSASLLFNRTDKARLNLITCAGTYISSRGTYDKRLIVYAVLASD
jgi:LPXTG-site transpeptidase (sortase) family protein